MTSLCEPWVPGGAVRVRMAGRADAAALVADIVAPGFLRREGWSTHAVRILVAGDASGEVVVPAAASMAGVAPRRLTTYLAGRYCAACALQSAGRDGGVPVASGEAGAPVWPAGIVGSISHATERAVAVVAESTHWRGLGVDCERVLDVGAANEVVRLAMPEIEAVDVMRNDAISWTELVTIGFSAKETLYKCLRPLVGEFFDFADARLTRLDRATQAVRLHLTRGLGVRGAAAAFREGTAFDVSFALADDHAYTCLALPTIDESNVREILS